MSQPIEAARVLDAPPGGRRRVLLSAFACSPNWGSEPGVGWNWALELSARHDVTVVTHGFFRSRIDADLARCARPGLQFSYFTAPLVGDHPRWQLDSRLYYIWWQFTVRRHVARLLESQPQDLIHHLTWGTYRLPSFLGRLGVPLAIGPVGGGEGAPTRLYRSWPWREWLFYRVRALSIAFSRWDPLVARSMRHAVCVLTKTRETRQALPHAVRAKAFEAGETGIGAWVERAQHASAPRSALRLLYAGRLLGGKGITYLLDAMRLLDARGVEVHLDVAGDGRLVAWAQERVQKWGLGRSVSLLGKLPRERMNALYDACDMLAFPSWHDSSGNVVTEALARGMPVLCLDLGGPRYAVDTRCAVIVPTAGLDEAGLAASLADHIEALASDRTRVECLSRGASERAREMTWEHQVARAYDQIEQRLGWSPPLAHRPEGGKP